MGCLPCPNNETILNPITSSFSKVKLNTTNTTHSYGESSQSGVQVISRPKIKKYEIWLKSVPSRHPLKTTDKKLDSSVALLLLSHISRCYM